MIKIFQIDKITNDKTELYECKFSNEILSFMLHYMKSQIIPESKYWEIHPEELAEYKKRYDACFKNKNIRLRRPGELLDPYHEFCMRNVYRLKIYKEMDIDFIQFKFILEGDTESISSFNNHNKFKSLQMWWDEKLEETK